MTARKPHRPMVCYVVCHNNPNYIRSLVLLAALKQNKDIDLVVVRNRVAGYKMMSIFRYVEIPFRLMAARLKHNPDIFIVGFRADEVFWLLYPAMMGKKKIFDEFVNIHDWFINEHKWFSERSILAKSLDRYMHWLMGRCEFVLTDTVAHAHLASLVFDIPESKIRPIPVATDEKLFFPRPKPPSNKFEIFFPGNMLPLHGLDVILTALSQLCAANPNVHVTLAGGKGKRSMLAKIKKFINDNKLNNQINHLPWINYAELPEYIARADLCLGGPFGNTSQAARIIPGKTFQFMAMAKATVIGHNDAHEYFEDKKNCLIVPRGDPTALRQSIEWAVTHSKELEAIGNQGRKLYTQYYSLKVVTERIGELLDGLR